MLTQIRYYKDDERWRVSLRNRTHNHGRIHAVGHFPAVRRSERTPEVIAKVKSLNTIPKLSANDICAVLRNELNATLHDADVYNILHELQTEAFKGRSPTQQFISELQNDHHARVIPRIANNGENGVLGCILWTYESCLDLWRQNSEILMADNTIYIRRIGSICHCYSSLESRGSIPVLTWPGPF